MTPVVNKRAESTEQGEQHTPFVDSTGPTMTSAALPQRTAVSEECGEGRECSTATKTFTFSMCASSCGDGTRALTLATPATTINSAEISQISSKVAEAMNKPESTYAEAELLRCSHLFRLANV